MTVNDTVVKAEAPEQLMLSLVRDEAVEVLRELHRQSKTRLASVTASSCVPAEALHTAAFTHDTASYRGNLDRLQAAAFTGGTGNDGTAGSCGSQAGLHAAAFTHGTSEAARSCIAAGGTHTAAFTGGTDSWQEYWLGKLEGTVLALVASADLVLESEGSDPGER